MPDKISTVAERKLKKPIEDELKTVLGYDVNIPSLLEQMEAYAQRTTAEYAEAREYYENQQAPEDVPDDIDYLVDNLISDLINRLHGNLVGSNINISYIGAKQYQKPLEVLTKTVIRETKLDNLAKSHLINNFLVEGLAGIKFGYDPFKKSIFGLGSPVVYIDDPENLYLDPGSVMRSHEDDVIRARKKRITLKEAILRWPEKKDEIISSDEVVTETDIEYVDLWDIEYKAQVYRENEQGVKERQEIFFAAKYTGKTVCVEPFKKTGYSRFTIIPFMHTPRKSTTFGRRPMGIPMRVKSSQDLRNILRSIMLEVAKGSTKHLAIITGAKDRELKNWDKEASKPFGRVTIENENAKVYFVPDRQLPPSLVQLDQMNRLSFDENAGDYAPERGDTSGQDLSGKAIALLQNKGELSQFTARENLESSFQEFADLIIETVRNKMTNPFVLYDSIDGEEIEIHYNTPIELLGDDYQPNKFEVINNDGVINSVQDFPVFGATVKIDLNAEAKRNEDLQKALVAFERQIMSRKDFTRELYPERWIEIYNNKVAEDQALQVVEEIMSAGPEFAQLAMEQIQRLKSILAARGQNMEAQQVPENRSAGQQSPAM